jgi:hypothetical protein
MFVDRNRETTTRIDAELALIPVPAMRPAQADFELNTAIIYARAEKIREGWSETRTLRALGVRCNDAGEALESYQTPKGRFSFPGGKRFDQ